MKRSEALKLIDEEYANFIEDWLKADITNLENFIGRFYIQNIGEYGLQLCS